MSKLNIKKAAALSCAAAMMSSLTGCGEKTTWGAVIDGVQIPAGVFIYYLDTANYDAQQMVDEQNEISTDDLSPEGAAAQTTETVTQPLYSSQIDGVDAKQWVYDKATEYMQEYAAVEAKFDEYGLALSDEDTESAQVYLDQIWDYAGDYYTSMGVSENSYKSLFLNSTKKQELFEAIYSEGGERAVSDDEIKAYLDENYALINYIDVELKDGEGNLLKSDGKAERMEMLNSYIERYKNGEDFDELNAEYVTYYENLQKAAEEAAAAEEAENTDESEDTAEVTVSDAEADSTDDDEELSGSEDEASETDEDESTEETTAPAEEASEGSETADTEESSTADEADDEADTDSQNVEVGTVSSNLTVIEKADRTVPCAEVAEKVFGSMNSGDIEIVESTDGEHYYLVVKLDILEDDEYFTTARDSLLSEMKSDEFDSIISEWTDAQSVSRNEAAYKRYDPEKMFNS